MDHVNNRNIPTQSKSDAPSSLEVKKIMINGEEIELYRRPKRSDTTSFGGYMQKILPLQSYYESKYPHLFASIRQEEEDILMTVSRIIDEFEGSKEACGTYNNHFQISGEAVAYDEATQFLLNEIETEDSHWWNALKR